LPYCCIQRYYIFCWSLLAIRDITNEVNETVKDLKGRGTIKDIASAVVETTNETRKTIGIAKAAIDANNTK